MQRHAIAVGVWALLAGCGAHEDAARVGDNQPAQRPADVETEAEEPTEERSPDLDGVRAAFECEGATGARARACVLVGDYAEATAIEEWPSEDAAVWWGPSYCNVSLGENEFDTWRIVFLSPEAAGRFGASGRAVMSSTSMRGQRSEASQELNRRLVAAAREGADAPDSEGVNELLARSRWNEIRTSPVWATAPSTIARTDAQTLGFEPGVTGWHLMRRSGDRIIALQVRFEDDGSLRPDFACVAELFHVTDAEVVGPDPDRPVIECGGQGLTTGSATWSACEGHALGYYCEEDGCRCERDALVVSRFDRPEVLPVSSVAHVVFAREHCGWNLEP